MYEPEFKEVLFDEFCKTCKHFKKAESEEPCCECLTVPANENSHKPVYWEE